MRSRGYKVKSLGMAALCWALSAFLAAPLIAQRKAEMSNMELVGYNDLQGRSAFQNVVKKQGERWIAYVGEQGDMPMLLNPLTGQVEPNGTSIVDVTDPKHPKYISHIPGAPAAATNGYRGMDGPSAAKFVHVCSGSELPHADKSKFYLLRAFGAKAWEIWDVTDPAEASRLNVIASGFQNTHNGWWECDSGIAYLSAGPGDWLNPPLNDHHDRGSHALIYDLSDPAKPVFVRNFGLPGQEPGSNVPEPVSGLHHVFSTGPKGNRVYFANGNAGDGILEIVDREKLLSGPKEPTDENLRYPVVARVDLPPDVGVHTVIPLTHMELPEFAKQKEGSVKDFLVVIGEGHGNLKKCRDARQMVRFFDVTTESKPVGVSTWTVPEASGNFCSRGGYFGTHDSNEHFTPIYYKRVMFISHFNAGVRALDIRDPYNPKEIGYYIPATTATTRKSCFEDLVRGFEREGGLQDCKTDIETQSVEVDDRGYIYIVDRQNAGMHILKLTGAARQVADFTQVENSRGQR
jgi:hypothetical protein